MKRKMKWITSFALSAFLCAGSGIALSNISASADVTPATATFAMVEGASVRLKQDSNGMRFAASIPAAEYTAIEDENTSYGVLIMPADYLTSVGELSKENVFGAEAKYDYAVWSGSEWVYNGTKTRIINLLYHELELNEEETHYVVRGSITNIHTSNVTRDFVARAYIRTGTSGNFEYEMADYYGDSVDNNTRSMYEVAKSAIADDSSKAPTPDEKTLLTNTYVSPYECTVTFDAQNGTTATSVSVLKGSTLTLPEEPVKDGYKFMRWVKDDWKFDWSTEAINENMVLKAKWATEDTFIDTDSSLMSYLNEGHVKWIAEKDGETGVIEITCENDKAKFNRQLIYPAFEKAHYEQYDKILVKAKASVSGLGLHYGAEDPAGWKLQVISSDVATDWTWYALDIDFFLDNYDVIDAHNMFYTYGNGTVWISEFKGYKNPTASADTFIDTDKAVASANAQYAWHKEFDGETGVIEAKKKESAQWLNFGNAGFTLAHAKEDYANYGTLVLKMKASVESINVFFGNSTDWKLMPIGTLTTEWKTYQINLGVVKQYMSNFKEFYAEGALGSIYISDMYVKESTPTTWIETNLENPANCTGNFAYHETYDGETGVIEIKTTGEGSKSNRSLFGPAFEKAHYEGKGYTELVFKMKASVENMWLTYFVEDTQWVMLKFNQDVSIATTWTEYTIDLETVLNNYEGLAALNNFYTSGTTPGSFYIADVYVR